MAEEPSRPAPPPRRINPRDVWTVLWVTLVFLIALYLLYELRRVLVWLFAATVAAAGLSPLVAFLGRRGLRRRIAVRIVVVALLLALTATIYGFVSPLVDQSQEFADNLPEIVDRVREAPVVESVVDRFNIENRIDAASEDLPKRLIGLSGPIIEAFKTVGEAIVAIVTIFVLMIFLLLYGPGFVEAALDRIKDRGERDRVEKVSRDLMSAVSGWVAGNVLTSIVAGLVSLIVFLILGLPYPVLLALWVAVADLIPLVGATLGALPAVIVGFIDTTLTGVIVTGYFIGYQQFENHVLQPYVYGRTIQLNPFIVLLSVIVGVELAGFMGALFALPVAGSIQVLINYALEERRHHHAPVPVEPDKASG